MISLNGTPVVGFGDAAVALPSTATSSPWPMAIATSVVGAVTGWALQEVANATRGKRR
jgi:hypothetical protein